MQINEVSHFSTNPQNKRALVTNLSQQNNKKNVPQYILEKCSRLNKTTFFQLVVICLSHPLFHSLMLLHASCFLLPVSLCPHFLFHLTPPPVFSLLNLPLLVVSYLYLPLPFQPAAFPLVTFYWSCYRQPTSQPSLVLIWSLTKVTFN